MTKRVPLSVRRPSKTRRKARAFPAAVALGLVLLQLATALHFALIPHALNAGLTGFEHVHRVQVSRAIERTPDRPSLVTGVATCAPDACPIGFAGPLSVLLARAALSGHIELPVIEAPVASAPRPQCRAQRLLVAPKTSPPRAA